MPFESFLSSFQRHPVAGVVSVVLSIAVYVGIAIAVPIILARLPADYFTRPPPRRSRAAVIGRALAGVLLVGAGVAMCFLPGPGIVAILLGLTIIGGDRTLRAARKLVARPRVLAAINSIRAKRGCEPLQMPAS